MRPPLSRMRRLRSDERGFGLIEMVIALFVLAIGISSVTGFFITGHLALRRASQSDTASVLADKLLERFRAETWDSISSSAALFASADSVYTGDEAYSAAPPTGTAVLDSTGSCSGSAPTLPVACNPSRTIPDTNQTPTEVAPDGKSYRLDTYVSWGCFNGTAPDMSTSPPTCTDAGTPQPFGQVKIVTIVVRDATNLSGAPVYRVTSTFDRLSGGSMPAVTVTPTTPGSTTTTTTTTTPTSSPDPPSAVTLANGGGVGNAYIDSGNANSLNFDVALPSSSQPTDTITLVVSDGNPAHDVTKTLTASSSPVHFTGINGQAFGDGTITFTATATNANGTSAGTQSTVTKDTVAPLPPTSVALQNGQGSGSAYINSVNEGSVNVNVGVGASSVATDSVGVTLTSGATTSAKTASAPVGAGTVLVSGINASGLTDGNNVTASATTVDAAGNASTATTATLKMDTVKPTLTGLDSVNGGSTPRLAEAGDTVTLTFSEAILASSLPASSTLSLTTPSGASKPVSLTMPGIASAAFAIDPLNGSGHYLSRGSTVTFSACPVSQPTSTTVKVTLSAPSNSSVLQTGPSAGASVSLSPASGLSDLAGNPVASTAFTKTLTFF